jgi:hypothetical protein
MTDERWIKKDLEGSAPNLIEVLTQNLHIKRRKTCQHNQWPGRQSNQAPPEYESTESCRCDRLLGVSFHCSTKHPQIVDGDDRQVRKVDVK